MISLENNNHPDSSRTYRLHCVVLIGKSVLAKGVTAVIYAVCLATDLLNLKPVVLTSSQTLSSEPGITPGTPGIPGIPGTPAVPATLPATLSAALPAAPGSPMGPRGVHDT